MTELGLIESGPQGFVPATLDLDRLVPDQSGMIAKLFRRRRTAQPLRQAQIPPGAVVWAVGDIHGRLDLLEPLLTAILEDLARADADRKVIVFLGDYIDRGPDSRGVIDLLCRLRDQPGLERHFLRGNHEDRMEAFLDDPELGPGWCDYGGREALRSYDVTPPARRADAEGWAAASAALGEALSGRHRTFLRDQESSVTIGDYFFAHAGARPGVALEDQTSEDLMWIRQAFLEDPTPFEKIVVHGHTPAEAVHADHRRIGIDTGAYATGLLTAVRLEVQGRRYLQARSTSGRIWVDQPKDIRPVSIPTGR